MVAGLKAVEESGHIAGDLGQAADSASVQFRKAHDSVRSALQEFSELGRTLQQAPGQEVRPTTGGLAENDAGAGAAARLAPEEWLGSVGELCNNVGVRFSGSGGNATGEQAGRLPDGSSPLPKLRGILLRPGAEPSASLAEHDNPATPAEPSSSFAGGPGEGRSASDVLLRAVEEARSRGLGGEHGLRDGMARSDETATFSDIRPMSDLGRRTVAGGVDPGGSARSERITPDALADYGQWRTADRDGGRGGIAATRRTSPVAADGANGERRRHRQDPRDEIEAWHASGEVAEGFDPREGIRRTRVSFPISAPSGESLAQERPMQSTWGGAGISPGGRDTEARIGGGATGVIERLLREQNDLIRQDIQRNASPPITAPPPMRGGGIRM